MCVCVCGEGLEGRCGQYDGISGPVKCNNNTTPHHTLQHCSQTAQSVRAHVRVCVCVCIYLLSVYIYIYMCVYRCVCVVNSKPLREQAQIVVLIYETRAAINDGHYVVDIMYDMSEGRQLILKLLVLFYIYTYIRRL